uniref:Methyltransferase type 11 domain-containing protein n=1 Tax=Heterosigma akashiwo TaxID=2829 RepID=A0A7S3YFG5_HETAK
MVIIMGMGGNCCWKRQLAFCGGLLLTMFSQSLAFISSSANPTMLEPQLRVGVRELCMNVGDDGESQTGSLLSLTRKDAIALGLSLFPGLLVSANIFLSVKSDNYLDENIHKEIFGAISGQDFIDVLEIGVGTAVNMKYYQKGTKLFGIDPYLDESSLVKAKSTWIGKNNIDFQYAKASAETLPYEDCSFDAVVGTLVMCTIPDPQKAFEEIYRVLRPGGKYLFVEHVLADGPSHQALKKQQEVLDPLQQILVNGCHLARKTENILLVDCSQDKKGDGDDAQGEPSSGDPRRRAHYPFTKLEQYHEVYLDSRWPINRQISGVLVR